MSDYYDYLGGLDEYVPTDLSFDTYGVNPAILVGQNLGGNEYAYDDIYPDIGLGSYEQNGIVNNYGLTTPNPMFNSDMSFDPRGIGSDTADWYSSLGGSDPVEQVYGQGLYGGSEINPDEQYINQVISNYISNTGSDNPFYMDSPSAQASPDTNMDSWLSDPDLYAGELDSFTLGGSEINPDEQYIAAAEKGIEDPWYKKLAKMAAANPGIALLLANGLVGALSGKPKAPKSLARTNPELWNPVTYKPGNEPGAWQRQLTMPTNIDWKRYGLGPQQSFFDQINKPVEFK